MTRSSLSSDFPAAARLEEPAYRACHAAALLPAGQSAPHLLFAHNRDAAIHPASLAKLAVVHIVYDRLKSGELAADAVIPISARARSAPEFKTGADVLFLDDALSLIALTSCNDAGIALAEFIAGSEARFVTDYLVPFAEKLGLKGTLFSNATGLTMAQPPYRTDEIMRAWPDPVSSAHDLMTLAASLIHYHPEFLVHAARRDMAKGEKKFTSTNPFIRRPLSEADYGLIDGLKTGSMPSSGYHLIATGVMNGQRYLVVNLGAAYEQKRIDHTAALIRAAVEPLLKNKESRPSPR